MNRYDKFDDELTKFAFKLGDKLKIHVAQTGTIDPNWYKNQDGFPGLHFIAFPRKK